MPARLKQAVTKFVNAHASAREKTNEANRIKTELRNTVKSVWSELELPIGSYIRTGGQEFRFEATESTEIANEPILDMFLNEEITREQFLRIFNVHATEAKNILGADQVATLQTTKVGSKLDVRMVDLPVENADDEYIAVAEAVKKQDRRRVFGGGAAKQRAGTEAVSPRVKRRIKIKR